MNQKKNNLVRNASVLMVASIVSRIIGLLYRRPLGAVLGAVGLGYYGYASNLYAILLLVSSYSIPMAVSKIVSERLALGRYKSAQKVFKGALLYAVFIGLLTALIAFFCGTFLLPANQQNALPALRILSPTIFLSAVLGVFRGYFQAHHTMLPTSISQIAEQIVNAVVSVLAAWLLIKSFAPGGGGRTAVFGAMGGTLGTGAGVLVGLFFMLFVYAVNASYFKRERRRDKSAYEESYAEVFRLIFLMITPIIFTTFVGNASAYLDSYLFAGIMGIKGSTSEAISAAYGEFSNYYMPIINIPLAMASASASAMMPEVSGDYATGDFSHANLQIQKTLRLTMFIAIPSMVGMAVLAFPIMHTLFPSASDLAGKLLLTGSFYVLASALSTITGSVLQSIGRQKEALLHASAALLVNLLSLAVMLLILPQLGIFAVMLAGILYSVCYGILNARLLRKYLGFRSEIRKTYLEPLAASAGMGICAYLIERLVHMLSGSALISLIPAVILSGIVYLIVYVLVSGISEEELLRFPLGTKLVRLLRIFQIYAR